MMVDLETLGSQERTWYEPAEAVDPERAAALASRSREQLAAELEDELRASVKRRLMADVPLGTMCSGGIDSSLITALAHDEDEGLVAYNAAVVDQPDADESPFAEQVTNHLGVELRSVQMTAETWRADLVDVVRHVEYPLTHESSVPMFQIAALAREDGVKVLLSGEGADELLAGYEWLHLREQIDFTHRRGSLERAARAAYRRLRGRRLPGDRSGRARSADVDSFERQLSTRARAAYRHHRGVRASYEAALLADLGTYLPHLLNRQDKSTMKASIETRVPFLDPEVVALAVNLPLEARAEPQLKGILRELAVARLPREIVDRPKRGFGFDAEAYIRAAARSQFLEEGALREVCGATSGQWRERVAAARGNDALLLWSGEIWCRALLEGQSTEQIELALWTAH
jgi:asparagine synthase (glutamine-hydrolysing)